MEPETDCRIFQSILDDLRHDFTTNPLQYGNEDLLAPEFHHRLRQRLDPEYLPVDYRQTYGDAEVSWRVRDFSDRVDDEGRACRIRPEVGFIHNGERWVFDRELDEERKSTTPKFDLVVFSAEKSLIGHSKKEGPGNFWDTDTEVSILCELKHSKNETSNFYAADQAADDIRALAAYPGTVEHRVFVFFDWWPVDGNENTRYGEHRERLLDNLGHLANPVDVIYVSRTGNHHQFQVS